MWYAYFFSSEVAAIHFNKNSIIKLLLHVGTVSVS